MRVEMIKLPQMCEKQSLTITYFQTFIFFMLSGKKQSWCKINLLWFLKNF